MAELNAYADRAAARSAPLARTSAVEANPLPRTVGITIALGVSLAMWAVLIEIALRVWSMLPHH